MSDRCCQSYEPPVWEEVKIMEAARMRLPNLAVTTNVGLQDHVRSSVRPGGIKVMTEEDMMSRYDLGEQVMESTNVGIDVVRAVRYADGLPCVVKIRKRPESFKNSHVEREWRRTTEVQLGMPKTQRLCQFYEVIETNENYYIVMEKVDGKDLFEVINCTKPDIKDAREIIRQTLEALAVMHSLGRIHKDLKIENVMVQIDPLSPKVKRERGGSSGSGGMSPASAKLIDFDTVEDWEPLSPKAKEVLGTDGYIAPEAYLGEYSPLSDIYACGVVMYKILVGEFPTRDDIFDDKPGENWVGSPQMNAIYDRLKNEVIDFERPPFDLDTVAADLCRRLLAFDATDRPTAQIALGHEWFAG